MTLRTQWRRFRHSSARAARLKLMTVAVTVGLIAFQSCVGSGSATAGDGAYVPSFSLAGLRVRVADLLASDTMEMLPTEVAVAWSQENFGFDPTTIEEVKVVAGIPMGPGAPPIGALIQLTEPFDPSGIDGQYLSDEETRSISGLEVTVLNFEGEDVYLAMVDSKTALLTTPLMFQAMAGTADGN